MKVKLPTFKKICLYLLFGSVAVFIMFPLIWLLILSFKPSKEFFTDILALPKLSGLNFNNYIAANKTVNMLKCYFHSGVLTAGKMVISLFFALFASFALSRFYFKFRTAMYTTLIMGQVVSVFSSVYPLYLITVKLGLINTYWSVILPNVAFTMPTSILVLTGAMRTMPRDFDDAVIIDGGGLMDILFRVLVPLAKPAVATTAILAFLSSWNDYTLPFIMLSTSTKLTVNVALTLFEAQYMTDYGAMTAGVVMAVIPVLVFYAFFQRYIMDGMMAGALKG